MSTRMAQLLPEAEALTQLWGGLRARSLSGPCCLLLPAAATCLRSGDKADKGLGRPPLAFGKQSPGFGAWRPVAAAALSFPSRVALDSHLSGARPPTRGG